MTYRDNGSFFGTSFVSFVAGSMIGAGIALLYAPQSGERTRQEMREKAERDKIAQDTIDATDKVNEMEEYTSQTLQNLALGMS
ncbi:MAG: YtxH domain-containing protein, partial [Deltaproteobacteria bacterium]|nr:YtxH domain-containing protein [Deltaproteobacteria bacterium]